MLSETSFEASENVLEMVEQILDGQDWAHERESVSNLHCIVPTRWGDQGGLFSWRADPEALHFSVTLDVKPTQARKTAVLELIALMNERLWLGHFEHWPIDDLILFRHTIPLAERVEPESAEVKAILEASTDAINRFTPCLNFVIWAGKTPEEAIQSALFETLGEA